MVVHWPLVGRDREIEEVTSLLVSDEHQGVALAGKAGVGKSRLAREVVDAAADAGWTVRRVSATSQSIPLGAFARWADDLGGAPAALAHRAGAALTADTRADRLLVFVDDAHLLDEALGAPPDRKCADRLWQLTHGNVLFLRELVDLERRAGRLVPLHGAVRWIGGSAVPPPLAELVDPQIGTVPESVCDVLDLVAVAETIGWRSLRLIADQLAIEEAEQRELIRSSDDVVHIGHPMYAEVRLNRCGPSRLRRLRGQVATAMTDGDGRAAGPAVVGVGPTARPRRAVVGGYSREFAVGFRAG